MHLLVSCLATVFLLVLHVGAASAAPSTFIYAGCSPSRYEPNTAFESNLNSVLASLASTASSGATYNSFTAGTRGATAGAGPEAAELGATASSASSAAYGLYQCRGDLGPGGCVACVQDTVARLGAVCARAYAASLQADGCYVRYGARDFVGRADTTVAYRQCSSRTSDDAGFLRSREAVLGELQEETTAAAAGYKVSTSGAVQGVAQCLGDVAAADCTACLAQAVAQLKGTCGAAVAADVYLTQCSVRYWANGYYAHPSRDYTGDDVWRTLAIIIGILAGLALIVVFIAFLRKSCN